MTFEHLILLCKQFLSIEDYFFQSFPPRQASKTTTKIIRRVPTLKSRQAKIKLLQDTPLTKSLDPIEPSISRGPKEIVIEAKGGVGV